MSDKTKRITLRSSAELAGAQTEYGGSDADAVASGSATSTTADKLVDSAADFSSGVAVGDIVHNTTDGTFALITAIDDVNTLSIGVDIMEDEEEYEIISGKGYVLPEIGKQVFKELTVILNVTAGATSTADHLDVYIDTSFDGGSSWINIAHFTQLDGDGGAKKYVATLKVGDPGATAITDVSSDAAEGATRQIGIGDNIRYRAVNTEDSDVAYTFSIVGFLK